MPFIPYDPRGKRAGVDGTALPGLLTGLPRRAPRATTSPSRYYDDHIQAYAYSEFADSFRGIPIIGTTVLSGDEFIEGGCYEETAQTETHTFRAGSYYGYNKWRADLRAQFNPDLDPEGPFFELLHFADNEGCIGPDAARSLLADFERHAREYRSPFEGGREQYEDWTLAARLAACGGLIQNKDHVSVQARRSPTHRPLPGPLGLVEEPRKKCRQVVQRVLLSASPKVGRPFFLSEIPEARAQGHLRILNSQSVVLAVLSKNVQQAFNVLGVR